MPGRRRALALAGVAAAAAAAGWALLAPAALSYDAWYSLLWGRELTHGRIPDYDTLAASTPHPLATAWSALAALLGDTTAVEAVRAIAWASFGALVAGVARLGQLTVGTAAGVVAAAVTATSYVVLGNAAFAGIDVTFVALVVWAAAVEVERPRRGVPVLALLGLAGLLRPEGWLLAAGYWLWLAPAADGRRRLGTALLAAAPPVLWTLGDLVAAGSLVHSLRNTQEAADAAVFTTGLASVPEALSTGLREALRAPIVAGGAAGLALALASRRARAAVPAAVAGVMVVWVVVLGVADLPLLDRFVLLPAVMLALFFGFAVTGWRRHAGRGRAAWAAGAALLLLGVLAVAPSQLDRLRLLRDGDDARAAAQRDIRELVRSAEGRRALARCDGLGASLYSMVPELAFHAGVPAGEVALLGDGSAPAELLLAPATAEGEHAYPFPPGGVEALRRDVLPAYREVASGSALAFYAGGACSAGAPVRSSPSRSSRTLAR